MASLIPVPGCWDGFYFLCINSLFHPLTTSCPLFPPFETIQTFPDLIVDQHKFIKVMGESRCGRYGAAVDGITQRSLA
jgi:hypothetical protein